MLDVIRENTPENRSAKVTIDRSRRCVEWAKYPKEMPLEEKDGNQGRIVDRHVHNSGFLPRKGRS